MKRLVLVGAGHAHAQVLLDWARAPLPGVDLTVVSPVAQAPYSGMVPGWLAGTYRFDQIVIDFAALCAAAGARWVEGALDRLDPQAGELHLDAVGPVRRLRYDVLSLNIGSTLRPPADAGARVLALRPLARLRTQYEAVLADWSADRAGGPFKVSAVGAGAAGVESLLAVLQRLRQLRPDRRVEGELIGRSAELLPGLAGCARRAAASALARAGVQLRLGHDWQPALTRDSNLVLWATGAQAHDWLQDADRRGGLAVDPAGAVFIDRQLRALSHPQVYAAGDCARWMGAAHGLPKSGVYAVRMGPVLSRNLRAALSGGRAVDYLPQRRHLVLLATGDGRAIAARGAFGAAGRWAWHWKDRIDRSFVARFALPPGARPAAAQQRASAADPQPPGESP